MNNKENKNIIKEKQQELLEKHNEEQNLAKQRQQMEREYNHVERLFYNIKPRKIKQIIRATGAYVLGRRNHKQLYSQTYKKKQASNDIKPYVYALYNEGFIEQALTDLQNMYQTTNNIYIIRAIAWELALWFSNKQTKNGAFQAIPYVHVAKDGENDSERLRRLAILEAECLVATEEVEKANKILIDRLQVNVHPDIYLALANTEQTTEEKLQWINKMYEFYQLDSITIHEEEYHYDALRMKTTKNTIDGPKVSVILPAYNAEEGIQIAIESILQQTWQNIELLIVDDCSPDNTLNVIQAYAENDERIKVFSTKANSGPYVARNIALEQATGEFVTINDADDWSHHDKIKIQVEHLLNNPGVLANTSEQARLTESLQFYRRGTPGGYVFSNMSSFMFRREVVMEKLGYWDEVRFAADGEFVRRFIRQFGEDKLMHLKTGPLSFPRQSDASLTSSSAFGYSGFFMGVRKEYVESFTAYHERAETLYFPKEQQKRLFPVPAPMHPTYKKGIEHFDVVMMLDITAQTKASLDLLEKELKKSDELGHKIAIVKKTKYDVTIKNKMASIKKQARSLLEKYDAKIIVYGESITCDVCIVRSPEIIQHWSSFLPTIKPVACLIIIDELGKMQYNGTEEDVYNFRRSMQQIMLYLNKKGRWYPLNELVRNKLTTTYAHESRALYIAPDNWTNETERHEEKYGLRLKDWLF